MKKTLLIIIAILPLIVVAQKKTKISKNKLTAIASADAREATMIEMSNAIWAAEEEAFQETVSSKILSDYAESQGFKVTRGVAEMPTAFIAEYGSGKPIIGILGEFDALPGLSQNTVPTKSPLNEGGAGHGCGHNIFGVASLGAAVAIKEQIEAGTIKGTVRFYGTPAEEKYFGKLWMARAGLFDDLDACIDWHPGAKTEASVQSSLALVDFIVEFEGQAAHASADPWNGRSAVDGAELYTTGINYLREHIKPTVRIHYHILRAGDVVNVVPDYAKVWTRVRDTRREGMDAVWKQVERIAEGASIMANVDHKITLVSGVHELVVNRTGGAAMQANMEYLGPITYSEEETKFAHGIQKATGMKLQGIDGSINPLLPTEEHPGGGSTDVGDVSWIVPTIRMSATIAPIDTPWHSWAVVACGGMSIGHKGLMFATKALSMTMLDLYENSKLLEQVKSEFKERKGEYVYKGILPDGPPPLNGIK